MSQKFVQDLWLSAIRYILMYLLVGKMVCVGLKTSDDVITIVYLLIFEIELFMYTMNE